MKIDLSFIQAFFARPETQKYSMVIGSGLAVFAFFALLVHHRSKEAKQGDTPTRMLLIMLVLGVVLVIVGLGSKDLSLAFYIN